MEGDGEEEGNQRKHRNAAEGGVPMSLQIEPLSDCL